MRQLTMHASHIKKDFFIKFFRSVFNENTYQFCDQKKILDLYLRKLQIQKKIRFVFNENRDQF